MNNNKPQMKEEIIIEKLNIMTYNVRSIQNKIMDNY